MKKYSLFVLLITITLLAACSGNDNLEENNNTPESDNENEMNLDNTNDNEVESEDEADEYRLADVSLDISDGIEKAYNYFDELYFSSTDIIDEEIGLKDAEVTLSLDDSSHTAATLTAYTIEPQNSLRLSVDINPEDFEDKLTKTDADGNQMAIEVADNAYEYAGDLIWKKDEHVYSLTGGRSVISSTPENEIHPEDDRLLFYENLVPTSSELKIYDEFYQNIKMPTQLPEGFSLSRLTVSYDQPQGFSKEPPAKVAYQVKGQNGEVIHFHVYGEYEEAPKLSGDDISEEVILETTVQIDEEKILFPLNDVTYQINYFDLPEEGILGIAESIIEQGE